MSAITLSELLYKAQGNEKALKIIRALNTANVEFLPFNDEAADYLITTYHPYLGTKALNAFARNGGWPEHDLVNGREWVNRDLMIAATAQHFGCDVILTCDVSTFYPMAQEIGCFGALAFADCFDISESERYIFRYDTQKAEDLFHRKTGRHSPGYQPASPGHNDGAGPADVQEGATGDTKKAAGASPEAIEAFPEAVEAIPEAFLEVVEPIPEAVEVVKVPLETVEASGDINAPEDQQTVESPETIQASDVKPE